jgi:hypothetical protein
LFEQNTCGRIKRNPLKRNRSHKAKINAIMPIIKPLPAGEHEIRTEVF